ncbi:STAS domain-containing protein [Mycolicibacterium brumae]|uniref:STAS domain-containing protein n=1 Tax=Mycolicibacterium brumae TaxID=85968 RepID=UPI000FF9A240|nr:STAS domain-containing protein [Mycolicibacterium brumae]MCV7191429.1 STAS domain-containing protein [Mycolicibacterium brumae]RWA16141.1 hypothetical protein MBRU_08510 [Mycolicibacterium brumae DSM 44177]UWW09463.1 STAS domain-containing protein [Mycolicibacterium brumae]
MSPTIITIKVEGELDAATAPELVEHATRHTDRVQSVVLDLSHLAFFGTAGLTALTQLDEAYRDAGVHWGATSCKPVERVLQICKADLPIHDSLLSALAATRKSAPLHLVSQSAS